MLRQRDYIIVGPSRLTVAAIQGAVASHYGIPFAEMTSHRRSRAVARPRQVAMYLARELTPKSLPDIGRCFGDRDHTTVMYALKAVAQRIETDADTAGHVELLMDRLAA